MAIEISTQQIAGDDTISTKPTIGLFTNPNPQLNYQTFSDRNSRKPKETIFFIDYHY